MSLQFNKSRFLVCHVLDGLEVNISMTDPPDRAKPPHHPNDHPKKAIIYKTSCKSYRDGGIEKMENNLTSVELMDPGW